MGLSGTYLYKEAWSKDSVRVHVFALECGSLILEERKDSLHTSHHDFVEPLEIKAKQKAGVLVCRTSIESCHYVH